MLGAIVAFHDDKPIVTTTEQIQYEGMNNPEVDKERGRESPHPYHL